MNRTLVKSKPWISILSICMGVTLAWGQGTAPRRPTVTGRALDADLRIRTQVGDTTDGRLNTAVPLNSGNPLVTGNVRYGRGFRGPIGYTNPFAFRGRLGTSSLNAFRGGSLTYSDLRAGTVPLRGAVPYYPTNSTILRPGAVAAGFARPGTNQPQSTGQHPLDGRIGTHRRVDGATAYQGATRLDASMYYMQGIRPGTGTPTQSTSGLIDRPLSSALPEEPLEPGRGYVLPRDPRLVTQPLGPMTRQDLGNHTGKMRDSRVRAPLAIEPQADTATPRKAKGEDVFEDLRTMLAPETLGPDGGPAGPTGPSDLWKPIQSGTTASQSPSPAPQTPQQSVRLTTLAGSKPTKVNEYLREAEKLMKAGEFDRATGKYRIASLLHPENPLPRLGWANSLIGQRMYATAAFHLRGAISRFPKLAAIEMNLPSFYPSRVVFAQILLNLVARIKEPSREPDTNLHLVIGYAFYFSKTEKDAAKRINDAIRHMKIILKANPKDEAARAFLAAFKQAHKNAAVADKR